MKNYLTELALCTIVASVCTFISYLLGLEESWQTAANTFGIAFLTMFVVGVFLKNKKVDKEDK
jgi:low affinity Fe/Cu permease